MASVEEEELEGRTGLWSLAELAVLVFVLPREGVEADSLSADTGKDCCFWSCPGRGGFELAAEAAATVLLRRGGGGGGGGCFERGGCAPLDSDPVVEALEMLGVVFK